MDFASPFAYLDAFSSRKPGGLGVCSSASCDGNDDDNINLGEILKLAFVDSSAGPVQLTDIALATKYNDGEHDPLNSTIQVSLDMGATWTDKIVVAGSFGENLSGTEFWFRTGNRTSYSTEDSFYVSAATVLTGGDRTNVPEPAALGMFGLGLIALGAAVRRRRVS